MFAALWKVQASVWGRFLPTYVGNRTNSALCSTRTLTDLASVGEWRCTASELEPSARWWEKPKLFWEALQIGPPNLLPFPGLFKRAGSKISGLSIGTFLRGIE